MKSTQNYKLFYNKTELNVFKQSPFIGNLVLKLRATTVTFLQRVRVFSGKFEDCETAPKTQAYVRWVLKLNVRAKTFSTVKMKLSESNLSRIRVIFQLESRELRKLMWLEIILQHKKNYTL